MAHLPTVLESRVRLAETDRQGVVFYGEFLTYQDEAFNQCLGEIDHPYDAMEAAGWTTPVAYASLDYAATAGFGDVLAHGAGVDSIGKASIRAAYGARQSAAGNLVAEGEVVHVAVESETGETARVPDAFRAAVRGFQDRPPTVGRGAGGVDTGPAAHTLYPRPLTAPHEPRLRIPRGVRP